ncbi:FAD-dependent monooxygenase [Streptomyces sp. 8N616]|uniref:FAD-dependent monooxygenase n=1 Tax=Streptomyces sp. 8N616 TaxID=3457414 RepID=UPI003FD0BD54
MTTVLIVGAGPTGLALACTVARAGVPVRIIDKSTEFHRTSRAKGPNQRSREVLADLGVGEEFTASGTERMVLRKYRGGVALADDEIFAGAAPDAGAPYAKGLSIPQWRTEEILRAKLAEYGVEIQLGCEIAELSQDDVGVTVRLSDGRRIEASYVVGCDGGHSPVRRALGVRFEGESEAEECMVCGDVEADGLDRDYWHQWFDEDGAIMLWPIPGTRAWQLQGTPEREAAGRLVEPSLETFQRLFDRHARVRGVQLANPTWISTYRINVRMAEHFRVGRVFLAGDAAHVQSIAGGLGMNTGIQDAFNLGWKLALVAKGLAGPGLLDTYEEERLPIAAWTLKTTNERLRAAREGIKKAGVGTEVVIDDAVTTLGVGYPWSSLAWGGLAVGGDGRTRAAQAGHRAPDAPCRDAVSGRPVRLFEVFAGPHFTLLGFGPGSAGALADVEVKWGDIVRTCLIDAGPDGVERPDWVERPDGLGKPGGLEDHRGHARTAYGVSGDALVLVRPDHHVALAVDPYEARVVTDYLEGLGR